MSKFGFRINTAYNWTKSDNNYFIGYCFNNNELLTGDEAIDYILNNDNDGLPINGIYTLITISKSKIKIKTDTINYFPVFFYFNNSEWIISDSWYYLLEQKQSLVPDSNIEEEFLNIGFVLGNNTIDQEIKKTKAGYNTILTDTGKIDIEEEWKYIPSQFYNKTKKEYHQIAKTIFDNSAKRMIKFLNGRTAVLPLSGGFDSRLIACLLKENNYENVICFTYGNPNEEVEVSQRVAKQLGYKWYYINYEELNQVNFLDTEIFQDFVKYTGNGFSMPFLQEYFAVKYLKENKLIPNNSVFLPGHSGDFLGGSYIEKTVKTNTSNQYLSRHLLKKYFFFFERKDKNSIINRIHQTTVFPDKNKISDIYNPYIEDWDIKEKLSKFIFHSSEVFNYFGYQHYFPLWDRELLCFFRNVPFELRKNKKLYDEILINTYFKKYDVYYQNGELIMSSSYKNYQKVKDYLRRYFPWNVVLKRMKKNDWMNYAQFCSVLETQLINNGFKHIKRYKLFTAVLCKWYLFTVNYYRN